MKSKSNIHILRFTHFTVCWPSTLASPPTDSSSTLSDFPPHVLADLHESYIFKKALADSYESYIFRNSVQCCLTNFLLLLWAKRLHIELSHSFEHLLLGLEDLLLHLLPLSDHLQSVALPVRHEVDPGVDTLQVDAVYENTK